MILSFKDKETEKIFNAQRSKKIPEIIQDRALRKLRSLHVATRLEQLGDFPGNNLESLIGDRKGQHSIRINKQFRICFTWQDGNAYDVEITDYH